jgi:hypothetical protein
LKMIRRLTLSIEKELWYENTCYRCGDLFWPRY